MGIIPDMLPNKIYINLETELTLENKQLPLQHLFFWDNIPVDLKNLNVFKFSKKLKHYLLSEQHSETLSYNLPLFCSTFIYL